MELHIFVLRERKIIIPGAADFGAAARRGHSFHTRPFRDPAVSCGFSGILR